MRTPRRQPGRLVAVAALIGFWPVAAPLPGPGGPVAGAPVAAWSPAALRSPATCSENAHGDLVNCPAPVARTLLPKGARSSAAVTSPVQFLAGLVDARTWTSSGGNTFPGADVPYGMIQWSPDTLPHRSDGGGYTYRDRVLDGYSLTHMSGPGCPVAGDIPILPMTGRLPSGDPTGVTTSFTNSGEIAQAGYYAARSNVSHTIFSEFTATPHTATGRFTFPRGSTPEFLIKLRGGQRRSFGTSAKIVSDHEVVGTDTTGNFCNETSAKYGPQLYTVHFDLVFDHAFTVHRITRRAGQHGPNAIFLAFPARSGRVVKAHAAISYLSIRGAQVNRQREAASWDFTRIRARAQDRWNTLLDTIEVSGGSFARTQEFYSLLYKSFLHPSIISDVTGLYPGSDGAVHRLASGQRNQYGTFSGWDIYHSLAQLQAMLDPANASDMARSLVNFYAQNGILPQWGFLNLDNYVMTGDPADALIASYYAFGARNFDTAAALAAMIHQATTVNKIRPGTALESQFGYLPQDATYGCCSFRNPAATLLEYDTADFALARFAAALGDTATATTFTARAGNWAHIYRAASKLLVSKHQDGSFVAGVTPTTRAGYTEGTAIEYLWDVPNDYAGLFTKLGGLAAVRPMLHKYLSRPAAGGEFARMTNEFDLGQQFALDYARDPAGTQRVVASIRNRVYRPGPSGLLGNDDLGSMSSQYIWDMLGFYPENPGSDLLVFASPGFPKAVIRLPGGATITIRAPGASTTRFYVSALTINGTPDTSLSVPFSSLATGATLNWVLTSEPTSWGTAPGDAPPSYGPAP